MIDEIDKTLSHWFSNIILSTRSKRYRRRNRKRLTATSLDGLGLMLYKERYWLNKAVENL